MSEETDDRLAKIEAMLTKVLERLEGPAVAIPRRGFSLKEAGEMLGKSPLTIREWCQLGRINAAKRLEGGKRGEYWWVSAEEITRYRDEGLLPIDPSRNEGRRAPLTLGRTGS